MDTIFGVTIGMMAIIILGVLIAKNQKVEVYLYFFLACILPSYFGFEISSSLPLITGTRILIIIMICYIITHRKKTQCRYVLREQKVYSILLIYFMCRIVAEIYFLPSLFNYSIKELFSIIFEQLLIVYLIVRIVDTKYMYDKCLKYFAYGAIIIMSVGILQSISGVNLAYYLNTVNRTMLQTNGLRLGFTRAEASFGHPVYFGQFCVLLLPIFSYLYDNLKQRKYFLFLIIDVVALVLSNSRGAILPGMIILVLMVISKKSSYRWKYIGGFIIILMGIFMLSIAIPTFGDTMLSIVKSVINIFGTNFDLGNYGDNTAGLDSRTTQLSGILWVIINGKSLFGFGPEAHMRGYVSYWLKSGWEMLETIDVGYVGFFLCEGIVGTIGQLILIWGLIYNSQKRRNKKDITDMNNTFFYVFLGYAILLLSSTGLSITYWTIIGLYIAYNNINKTRE